MTALQLNYAHWSSLGSEIFTSSSSCWLMMIPPIITASFGTLWQK